MRELTLGKIYKNGIQYSGTTDAATNINYDNSKGAIRAGNVQGAIDEIMETTSQSRNLTQAEYDALPDTKYTDNIEYFITDAEPLDASTIAYDNTASKMTATNVQAGIDELNSNLTQFQSQIATMFNNAGAHNAIYRGKNLGTSVTTAQYNAIKAGTFDDLYIGDYWVINGKTWRIAAFDYFLHNGDTECTTHHAVIVPDECLYNAQMNTTNDTTGGYVAVKTRGVLTDAETAIKAAFGASHILSNRVYLTNAVANGKPSGGAWVDTICDLMNEEMVYGTGIFRPTSDSSTVPANYRVEKSQLPLFAHEPSRIINRADYWLRDVVTAARFAFVGYDGNANYNGTSNSLGVRPAFCIS